MTQGSELEDARERIRRAEQEFEAHLFSCRYDPNELRRVRESLNAAREEFIDKLARLWPGGKEEDLL